MNISITYIHHNCFVMKTEGRTFLFDYPGDAHLPDGGEAMVQEAVAGTDLAVFISHSHEDHLNNDLVTMASTADSVRYVLSDDVEDMRPETIPSGADVLIVEPDERYELGGMIVETLLSNDLGVAFMVEDGDFRFYFGGDLAKWVWPSASEKESSFTERFYRRAMERVRDFKPHVAFSNVDRRLDNLAGGDEACRFAGAEVFVPMHTFGQTDWLSDFQRLVGDTKSRLFIYSRPGEKGEFSF
ncbi:MBL fold metallo-hydrolase [uncultured Pseudodesulfovibrio sp.]|uniref:MBL fold metallo-hydrolase n=1 Tax=uncultured Pseudodesulfovibrio sp. TaxID=2035858 RepID=UPI0029C8BF9E|nr:MBL fold metallo-hydrolase [uncultured Pseudodesulfovibrio sp.]